MSERGLTILLCLATALTAGFIVGAEREQEGHASFGGVRTFPLFALAGAIGALIDVWLLVALGLAVGGLVAVSYVRDTSPRTPDGFGLSTEMAALATFGLGALTTARIPDLPLVDRLLLVGAGTVAVVGLLALKRHLHAFVAKVSKQDIYATLRLLLLLVIVLPLLPNRDMGPFAAFNPFSIGWLVVLISAMSFAGYVAIRVFGAKKGIGLTGLLGGLASSTAVTLTFSGRAKETPSLADACAVAIVLASSTMFPRLAIELTAVSPELAGHAALPLGVATVVGLGAGGLLYARLGADARVEAQPEKPLPLKNPFTLRGALKFAALFAGVLLFSRAASHYFSDAGVLISAGVTGLADVDAISLSVAQMVEDDALSVDLGVVAVAIATAANTTAKAGIALVLGGGRLAARVALSMAAALGAGTLAALFAA